MANITMDPKRVKKGCKAISAELKKISNGVKYKQENAYDFLAKRTKSNQLKTIADKIREGTTNPLLQTLKETNSMFTQQIYNEADQIEKILD